MKIKRVIEGGFKVPGRVDMLRAVLWDTVRFSIGILFCNPVYRFLIRRVREGCSGTRMLPGDQSCR